MKRLCLLLAACGGKAAIAHPAGGTSTCGATIDRTPRSGEVVADPAALCGDDGCVGAGPWLVDDQLVAPRPDGSLLVFPRLGSGGRCKDGFELEGGDPLEVYIEQGCDDAETHEQRWFDLGAGTQILAIAMPEFVVATRDGDQIDLAGKECDEKVPLR